MAYKEAIQTLVDFGLLDVILPFILVFTISYALFQKTRVFGEEKGKPRKNINAMVAFVLGFFAVLVTSVVNIITLLSSTLALTAIIGLCFALITGLATGKASSAALGGAVLTIFTALALNAFTQAGVLPPWTFYIVAAAALIGVIIYILLPKKAPPPQQPTRGAPPPEEEIPEITEEMIQEAQKSGKLLEAQRAAQKESEKAARKAAVEAFKKTIK